jgi:uncharacterized membrane protein YfcA
VVASSPGIGRGGGIIRYVYVVVLLGLAIFLGYDYWRGSRVLNQGVREVSTAGLARRVQLLKIPPRSIKIPGFPPVSTYVSLPVSRIDRISVFVPISVGFAAGFFAGLLGAGGGTILIFIIGVPTTVAIGTDLFQIIITGSIGTFIKSFAGHVDPVMVVLMLVAASAGAQLGAAATRIVEAVRIRILYGVIVLAGSVAVGLEQASESFSSEFLSTVAAAVLLGVSGAMYLVIALMLLGAQRRKPPLGGVYDREINGHATLDYENDRESIASKAPSHDTGD